MINLILHILHSTYRIAYSTLYILHQYSMHRIHYILLCHLLLVGHAELFYMKNSVLINY